MSSTPFPCRVAIDGYNLAIPRGTGVATYARTLAQALHTLGHPIDLLYGLPVDPKASPAQREVEFYQQIHTETPHKRPKYPHVAWWQHMARNALGFTAQPIPLAGRVIPANPLPPHDRILNIPNLFHRANHYFRTLGRIITIQIPNPPAIMHWTYPLPIRLQGALNLYTIHDIVPLRLPYTTLDHKPTHVHLLQTCIRIADHICTVSETSRNDILDFFPDLPPDRITNTYQSISPPTPQNPAALEATLQGAFDLNPRGYFLFFGSIEPKKNVGRLLQAFLSTPLDIPLVIVGARAWQAETELALLANRPPGDRRIRQIDYLPAETLATLVQGARAVVFPSLYEGFGLPMLEAMALGTPVIASREGALPEIGADAILPVDAYDPASIATALTRLAHDDALCADLAARGRRRAQDFTMPLYQDRLTALYDRLTPPTRP